MVAHDSRAAQYLDGVGCDGHRDVGGEGLRVGAEQPGVLARVECRAGAPDEEARRLDVHRHVGELEADALAAEDWAAERLALARVLRRVLERGAGNADGAGGDLRPGGLEEVQRDLKSLSLLADEAVERNPGAVEDERARVRGAKTELVLLATRADAGIVALDEERRDLAVELREDDRQVGDAAVRDVHLFARQDVRLAVEP